MEIEKLEIYRGIAEMAYVIAKVDKGLSSPERIAFNQIIKEELDYDSWAAQSRFELLDEVIEPSIEKVYNDAIHDFKKYRAHFTDDLKEKCLRVITRVAQACSGFSEKEAIIIDRFKQDLRHL